MIDITIPIKVLGILNLADVKAPRQSFIMKIDTMDEK